MNRFESLHKQSLSQGLRFGTLKGSIDHSELQFQDINNRMNQKIKMNIDFQS